MHWSSAVPQAPRLRVIIPLETQILRKQGKESEAMGIIETAMKEKHTPQLSLVYAEMLMETKRNEDAVKVYEELLGSQKTDKKAGPAAAALYNNMAWAMLQSEKSR